MPVKQIFDTQDAVPEFLRSAVIEQDGKWVFEAELPHEVAGLKSALEKERKTKADYEKSLKSFEGVDPEEARRLKAEAEQAAADKLKNKGDWETREKQLKEQLAKDLAAREQQYAAESAKWQEREAALRRAIEQHLIEAQATAAISAAKGVPELLLPHVLRQTKVIEENGEFVVRVLDGQGQPRIADVKGTPFGIVHLVEEMKNNEIFGRAFEASGAGGSGAQNGNKGAGSGQKTMTRAAFDQMGNSERMAFINSGGKLTD